MENQSSVTGWQELFFSYKSLWFLAAVADRYFWDIRLKILRLPNFIMLFQLVLTTFSKSELFSCFPESWSRDKGMYEMYENKRPNSIYLFIMIFLQK